MKIHLKFDHSKKTVLESIDCPFTAEDVSYQIDYVVEKFMRSERHDTKGHLAELMHDELDYTIILLLALKYVTEDIEKKAMKNRLRKMLDNDEII